MKVNSLGKGNLGKESSKYSCNVDSEIEIRRRKRITSSFTCQLLFIFLIVVSLLLIGILIGIGRWSSSSHLKEDGYPEDGNGNENENEEDWNNRPIIGVLAQEVYETHGPPITSYIAASYVKFIEGGGGRVAPILINKTEEYYKFIFNRLNGSDLNIETSLKSFKGSFHSRLFLLSPRILFPGGSVYFDEFEGGYVSAGKILLSLARSSNDQGQYFPVWGTCLGFEFLIYEGLGGLNVLEKCHEMNKTGKLEFTKDASRSRLFGRAPSRILHLLSTLPVTANFHSWCLTLPIIQHHHSLTSNFKFLSWSEGDGGTSYVSSLEHHKYPIYGVQFHPEKNMYEWSRTKNIPHTRESIRVGQYFAQFIVSQARKSRNSFGIDDETKYLIYNWNVTYAGGKDGTGPFEQIYSFPLGNTSLPF